MDFGVVVVIGLLSVGDGDDDAELEAGDTVGAENEGGAGLAHFVTDLRLEVDQPNLATLGINRRLVHQICRG